jgi:outer membrane receptor protein involved in Fe transport
MHIMGLSTRVSARTRLVLLTTFLLTAHSILHAQNAALSGSVTDSSGGAVQSATVTLVNEATNAGQHGTTNRDGIYVLSFVKPGVYTLRVEAAGFKRHEQTAITIETAQHAAIDVRLELGDVAEAVTVDGSGVHVNTVNASVSTLVDRKFVENMPLNGRSFQSLMTLVPGVTVVPSTGVAQSGGFSVNGQRTESNYFTVDGVSANTGASAGGAGGGAGFSGSTPGQTVLGTTQSMVSVDALQEFRAMTSTYSAEYGRTPGGQFSFLTRSGTNEWHGSAFNYLRNDALDANAWFNGYLQNPALPKQAERQNDFGGTLGGPVRIPGVYDGRDETFFFASYEGLRLRSPSPAQRYVVPSIRLRNAVSPAFRPTLAAFPLPDNPNEDQNGVAYFTSGYSSPSTLDSTSVRVDHSFSNAFKVFGRYASNPSNGVTRGSNLAQLNRAVRDVDSITLGATNIVSPRLANDLRVNFTQNTATAEQELDSFGGATPYTIGSIPGMTNTDWYGFYFFLGERVSYAFTPTTSRQRQLNIVDSFTASLGRHTVKLGFDYRRVSNFQSMPFFYQWSWAFSQDVMLANNFDTVALYRYTMPVKPVYTNVSAYVQDEWKVNPRLSLSLGLRWDVNPAPGDSDGNIPYTIDQITDLTTTKLAPKGTRLWKTAYKNFAPRIGAAYQLRQDPSSQTVLRAGFGTFYDTGNATASQGYTGIGSVYRYFTSGVFPATQATLDSVPQPNVNPPYGVLVYGYDPELQLPYTLQWNAAIEQTLGAKQTLSVSYVGAAGRRLTLLRGYDLGASGNPNFAPGAASNLLLVRNGARSDYKAVQTQFQRRLSQGLQALLTYTWSHATDDASTNFQVSQLRKADADFDIRHSFQAAVTYEVPGAYRQPILNALLTRWSLDARIMSRSGLPVDVTSGLSGVEGTGMAVSYHPDRVASAPLYIYDASYPGGRQINPAAFVVAKDANGNNIEGNVPRNYARGFGATQVDVAVRREVPLSGRVRMQFRVEAFNVLNHPMFGAIYGSLNTGTDASGRNRFGQAYQTLNNSLGGLNALYQVGGNRSLQVAVKLLF